MREQSSLLDGESQEWSPADARHWICVYSKLVAFCQTALAAAELGDGVVIRNRLRRFEARLAFWQQGLESRAITKA